MAGIIGWALTMVMTLLLAADIYNFSHGNYGAATVIAIWCLGWLMICMFAFVVLAFMENKDE